MLYHIYANRSNIGDWISAKGIQSLLAQENFTDCFCDQYFLEETFERLSAASPSDMIIIGGGGLIMDYFIPFWERFENIAKRVPFCIWGIGCCDLKNENSLPRSDIFYRIIENSKLVYVRDQLTRSFFGNPDLPDPVPCPSINVINRVDDAGSGLLHVFHKDVFDQEKYDHVKSVALSFCKKNAACYRETNNRIAHNNQNEMDNLLKAYESARWILSSALHGCIIGAALGKKVLAISGDRKVEGFMNLIGLQDWVIDINDTGPLEEKLDQLDHQLIQENILQHYKNENVHISEKLKYLIKQ